MPAVNQGSRLGLVAWTIVSTILAVTCSILAIYFYVASTQSADQLGALTKQFDDVVTKQILANQAEDIQKLKDARSRDDAAAHGLDPSMKAFQVALAQRNSLAKLISGKEDDAAAYIAAKSASDKAKAAGAKPAGDSLTDTINALAIELDARKADAANSQKDSKESREKLTQVIEATKGQIDSMTKAMSQVNQEKDAALDQVQKVSTNQAAGFEGTASDLRKQLETANTQITQLNDQNGELGGQITKLKNELALMRDRLGEQRTDPTRAVVQRADGQITRVLSGGGRQCLIDLGRKDHVTPGLTFEVYDQVKGIPAAGDPSNNENLPVGKASIIVKTVNEAFSLCEITSTTPGTSISEGDLIVNLVYDKNLTSSFVVYGSFDLDQNGVATSQDAELIKQLITQWGGKVMDNISATTDFVVLGKEPVVGDKPTGDDPLAIEAYNKAVLAADEYSNILSKAREYRLPVLNQNRFLLFTGYYDVAQR